VIVYESTRGEFTDDVFSNAIEARILRAIPIIDGLRITVFEGRPPAGLTV